MASQTFFSKLLENFLHSWSLSCRDLALVRFLASSLTAAAGLIENCSNFLSTIQM